MRELLSPESFESFRALCLDGLARLKEAERLIHDVQASRITRPTLDPVIREVEWAFESDLVLKEICGDEIRVLSKTISNRDSDLKDMLYAFRHLIERSGAGYKQKLEDFIVSSISKEGGMAALRQAVGAYVSHALNIGYSRSFLAQQVEDTFFRRTLSRTGPPLIRGFFARVDGVEKEFLASVGVNDPLAVHLRSVGFGVKTQGSDVPPFVSTALASGIGQKFQDQVLIEKIKAMDSFSAGSRAVFLLRNLKSLAMMAADRSDFEWNDEVFISRPKAARGEMVPAQSIFERSSYLRRTSRRSLKAAQTYTRKVLAFPVESRSRFMRAIDTSVAAHELTGTENRLVAYWSAVEVLFASPNAARVRILHYIDLLAPCICSKYFRRMISAAYNDLVLIYRRRFSALVSECPLGDVTDQQSAFAALLLLPEHADRRNRLMTLIGANPLAAHRVWQLEKLFGTPQELRKSVVSHEDRIRWQLHRIYRARNSIAHARRAPVYLDSLTLNMIEYFRTTLSVLLAEKEIRPGQADLDQIAADVGIGYQVHLERLSLLRQAQWQAETLLLAVAP